MKDPIFVTYNITLGFKETEKIQHLSVYVFPCFYLVRMPF